MFDLLHFQSQISHKADKNSQLFMQQELRNPLSNTRKSSKLTGKHLIIVTVIITGGEVKNYQHSNDWPVQVVMEK